MLPADDADIEDIDYGDQLEACAALEALKGIERSLDWSFRGVSAFLRQLLKQLLPCTCFGRGLALAKEANWKSKSLIYPSFTYLKQAKLKSLLLQVKRKRHLQHRHPRSVDGLASQNPSTLAPHASVGAPPSKLILMHPHHLPNSEAVHLRTHKLQLQMLHNHQMHLPTTPTSMPT